MGGSRVGGRGVDGTAVAVVWKGLGEGGRGWVGVGVRG